MPSLITKKTKTGFSKEIRFYSDGKHKSIFVGQRSDARLICEMLDTIIKLSKTNDPTPAYVQQWVESLDDPLYERLANAGVLLPRSRAITLEQLYQQWVDYPVDRKENTYINNRTAFKRVADFFDVNRAVESITEIETLRFKQFLQKSGYATATISGVFRKISGWFTVGKSFNESLKNPFSAVKTEPMVNESRRCYVKPEWYPLLLDNCPEQGWRTLITLARIGGLRVDSETSILRWCDIDWEENLLTVRSPKTERYPGKDKRIIPLFKELRQELKEQKKITGRDNFILPPKFNRVNSKDKLLRIFYAAGLDYCEKPFSNMRASREMDLLEHFPAHVVSAWMGHSIQTERKHYVYAREEDYEKANSLVLNGFNKNHPTDRPTE